MQLTDSPAGAFGILCIATSSAGMMMAILLQYDILQDNALEHDYQLSVSLAISTWEGLFLYV